MKRKEIWRTIPRHSKYQVSNHGRIRNSKGQILAPWTHTNVIGVAGWLRVTIKNDRGVQCNMRIHRAVMLAFRPVRNAKNLDVDHINGRKNDNRLSNLEWVTHSENIRRTWARR